MTADRARPAAPRRRRRRGPVRALEGGGRSPRGPPRAGRLHRDPGHPAARAARLRPPTRSGCLIGVVVLLLVIACVNVGNLQLARASVREHEVQVRAALGATSGRLFRQFLSESALLAIAGAALGCSSPAGRWTCSGSSFPRRCSRARPPRALARPARRARSARARRSSRPSGSACSPRSRPSASGARSPVAREGATSRKGRLRALLVAVQVALAIVPPRRSRADAAHPVRALRGAARVPAGARHDRRAPFGPPRYASTRPPRRWRRSACSTRCSRG